jgi:N-acyl-D-aspartate/D-glutamate deacylase
VLDLAIRGAQIADGTGAPLRVADIGVRAGRIAELGQVGAARREIDASDRIVAPGFVDIHTHYDAQVLWDPLISPSSEHGVTSVIGGNCGFSLAPLSAGGRDYLLRMLARVEGMPLESLELGVPCDWSSFGEYLARLDGRLAINAGFLVGHSTLRRTVMGAAAVGEKASAAQRQTMRQLLGASLAEGGLGFSTSLAPTHLDGDGNPVPSRHADREEILELCSEVRAHAGTTLEMVPPIDPFPEELVDLMVEMSLAAQRPLNWNVLNISAAAPQAHEQQLAASDVAARRGARIVALTLPQVVEARINLHTAALFDALPGWAPVMSLPIEERMRALRDPSVRAALDAGTRSRDVGVLRHIVDWERLRIVEVFREENERWRGCSIAELAAGTGKAPLDALLDLALDEGLRTSFLPDLPGQDEASWQLRGQVWSDPRTLVGASDAGAHLDMIDTFAFGTRLLAEGVRERGLIRLEAAIQQLTDAPARLYGLRDRGRIAEGWCADLVVFDPDEVGPGPVHSRNDLPGAAMRLYAAARGIEHVIVNGVPVLAHGAYTTARPGRVLRSGRDTETVLP